MHHERAKNTKKITHLHEAQRVLDLGRHLAVLGALGCFGHKVHVPGVELVDVGETTGREGPQEVDRLHPPESDDGEEGDDARDEDVTVEEKNTPGVLVRHKLNPTYRIYDITELSWAR